MKKNLLLAGLMISGVWAVTSAETKVYSSDELGEVGNVSDNGKYVAVSDVENRRAYLWSADTPEIFVDISAPLGDPELTPLAKCVVGTSAADVADNGMVVGSVYYADGHQEPAYYIDGEWYPLELHYAALNTNEAMAVTPDGGIIAGYQFINDPTSEIGGRYYPVQWKLDGDAYVLHAYTDIELPDHQGLIPYAQSKDGRIIGGTLYCGTGSMVPVLVVDGQMRIFDKLETRMEKWEYRGQWYCGTDEEGNQIWTDDPDDPRIVLFPEYYIDGWHDDGSYSVNGAFLSCDADGNFYGLRTRVEDADDEGNATLVNGAAIYNVDSDSWTYDTSYTGFSAGLGADYVLTSGSEMIVDGSAVSVFDEFSFATERSLAYLKSYSADGSVIGGMTYEVNPANGEMMYYPLVIVLDRPLVSGIDDIVAGGVSEPVVILSSGRIDVANASSVTVYDVEGRAVSTSSVSYVTPGIYVVVADGVSRKVVVR